MCLHLFNVNAPIRNAVYLEQATSGQEQQASLTSCLVMKSFILPSQHRASTSQERRATSNETSLSGFADQAIKVSDRKAARNSPAYAAEADQATEVTYRKAALKPHLPMQPIPKRVGSSEVNIMASRGRCGLNPASLSAFKAAIPPTTPSVPSYIPASGIASVCEPVTTAPVRHRIPRVAGHENPSSTAAAA